MAASHGVLLGAGPLGPEHMGPGHGSLFGAVHERDGDAGVYLVLRIIFLDSTCEGCGGELSEGWEL